MAAGRYDRLVIEQGATFELPLRLKRAGVVWDLTGATLRWKVRRTFSDSAALLTGDVVVDSATGGRVTLFASATATAALTIGDLPQGFLPVVWDLEILEAPTANGVVTRLLEGRGRITPEATK